MKYPKILFLNLVIFSLGFGLILLQSSAQATRRYVSTPTSLRGTWYHYDSEYGYSKLHITKYHFSTGSVNLSGNKFPKYALGHAQMFVYKNSKGYYHIGKYATDEWPYWKKVKHNNHTAIRQISYSLSGHVTDYWYRTKNIARNPKNNRKSTRSFHGYQVEAVNTGYNYNTIYDSKAHSIISMYQPTQNSKVIFQFDSHVIPENHPWVWVRGNNNNLLTTYVYDNYGWKHYEKSYNTKNEEFE